jgi:hypothetical protein
MPARRDEERNVVMVAVGIRWEDDLMGPSLAGRCRA